MLMIIIFNFIINHKNTIVRYKGIVILNIKTNSVDIFIV